MLFANRTDWDYQPNKLTTLLDSLRNSGKQILDLTVSNPTECGFGYPNNDFLEALSSSEGLEYHPEPHGLLSGREAVCEYYKEKNIFVGPANIFLTASTSEAYSHIFKLLCNAGDGVLVPKPSYPLFEYLAQVNDVNLQYYKLRYDGEWHLDIESLNNLNIEKIGKIKAIVIVNPHNPTGMFLKKNEFDTIKSFAVKNNLALIVDEVFIDYPFEKDENRIGSTANETDVLTFTLNGISKSCGLPQMKLGWIVVSGSAKGGSASGGESLLVSEAIARLEIICDTFLSVNTPVQVALPELFEAGKTVQQKILERVRTNYSILQNETQNTPCSPLTTHGGWYGIIRVPRTKSDEEWALQLLEKKSIYVHPGYFFDFDEDDCLVVSLLVEEKIFHSAIQKIVSYMITKS